jgi:hypothetical protein
MYIYIVVQKINHDVFSLVPTNLGTTLTVRSFIWYLSPDGKDKIETSIASMTIKLPPCCYSSSLVKRVFVNYCVLFVLKIQPKGSQASRPYSC